MYPLEGKTSLRRGDTTDNAPQLAARGEEGVTGPSTRGRAHGPCLERRAGGGALFPSSQRRVWRLRRGRQRAGARATGAGKTLPSWEAP